MDAHEIVKTCEHNGVNEAGGGVRGKGVGVGRLKPL